MKNDNQVIPFTASGYQAVISEITTLNMEREAVLVRLQTAREMGDLSENGAYKAARWELGGIDRRLRELNRLQLMGRVVKTSDDGLVGFGSRVKLSSESGTEITYVLVNEYESDPMKQKLSINSPLGSQLLGKKVGDTIEVIAPAGRQNYRVLEIGPLSND